MLFQVEDRPALHVFESSIDAKFQPTQLCRDCQKLWDESALLSALDHVDWEAMTFVGL